MVCSLGGGQMATLLEGGSTSQIMTEEAGCWKLAAQYIQRELREVDETNLLDEEDMHIFGLRPMIDPLILVCCNSCKKPVKASQYAAHAEICKSLSSVADSTLELDVGAGQKKPPRKERKKIQITCSTQAVSVGVPERATHSVNNTAALNSHVDEQMQMKTSIKAKGKLVARGRKTSESVTGHQQTPSKLNDSALLTKGMSSVPAPLATKIYYSQRSNRLRSSLSCMYYKSSLTHCDHSSVNMHPSSRITTPNCFGHGKSEDHHHEKLGKHVVENPHELRARSSEVILDEPSLCPQLNSTEKFHVNNPLGPERSVGNSASDFLQNPCLFAEN